MERPREHTPEEVRKLVRRSVDESLARLPGMFAPQRAQVLAYAAVEAVCRELGGPQGIEFLRSVIDIVERQVLQGKIPIDPPPISS